MSLFGTLSARHGEYSILTSSSSLSKIIAMAGFKRSRRDSKDGIEVQNQSPYHALFDDLRAELDEHHDRRERIVQASRDVTAQSKKT